MIKNDQLKNNYKKIYTVWIKICNFANILPEDPKRTTINNDKNKARLIPRTVIVGLDNKYYAVGEHPCSTPANNSEPATVDWEWFVLRDLKRSNAKAPAYKQLSEANFEVFTPLYWRVRLVGSRRIRECVPFVQDLLFVHSTRDRLDTVVDSTPTLQYRYERGKGARCPMKVREKEMNNFIAAVGHSGFTCHYYQPLELRPSMIGRKVRIVGGALHTFEGRLLSIRGCRRRRVLVEIPGFIAATVEVEPEFIELIDDENETKK